MKIRKGFVTNSSSSSYICEICGEVESGYDISRTDSGIYQCENGHEFCYCHVTNHFPEYTTYGDIEDDCGFDFMDHISPEILLKIAQRSDVQKASEEFQCSTDLEECIELLTLVTTKNNKKKGKKEAEDRLKEQYHEMRNKIMLLWSVSWLCENCSAYYEDKKLEAYQFFNSCDENIHEKIIEYIRDFGYNYGDKLPEELCPICQMKEVSNHERERYMLAKLKQKRQDIDKEILSMSREDFLSMNREDLLNSLLV